MEKVFACKRCGFCCHGETTVSLSEDDQSKMLEVLEVSREEALQRYWRETGVEIQMKTIDGHCVFYDEGCTVHRGRPWRCRQWPLVPAILYDEVNLGIIRSSCPGIVSDVSYRDICRVVKKEIC